MNRLILKYPYPITAVILLIFAWVVIQRLARGVDAIIPLAVAAVIVWPLGTFVFVYLWPRITVGGFKRAIVNRGFGGGPIPINTLYAVPERPSDSASSGSLMAVGTDDLVYIGGWLDAAGRAASAACARDDGTVLQRAVHRSGERLQLRLCRKADHRDRRRRLPRLRADVDRERARRDDPDRRAASIRPRHRPRVRRR